MALPRSVAMDQRRNNVAGLVMAYGSGAVCWGEGEAGGE